MSLYLFLIAINPLAVKMQNDIIIQGIKLPVQHSVNCPCYADDITLTLIGKASLRAAFRVLENFKTVSSLKLNMSKTQGLCRSQYSEIGNLPPIKWTNETLDILGLVIGNTKSVEKHWKQCIKNFSEEIQNLSLILF